MGARYESKKNVKEIANWATTWKKYYKNLKKAWTHKEQQSRKYQIEKRQTMMAFMVSDFLKIHV